MKIYHHWLHASVLDISKNDIEALAELLQIEMDEFNITEPRNNSGTYFYKLSLPGSADAVHITLPGKAHYSTITLKGAYFDAHPTFDVGAFRDFVYSRSGNFKNQDITFEDDTNELNINDYKNMCSLGNYKSFMTGSSVTDRKRWKSDKPDSCNRNGIPDPHSNFDLIHFGNLDSSYCAKAYTMKTGNVKFELSINSKPLNKALLDIYDKDNLEVFNQLAKESLVKCVNFVLPSSKKAKRLKQVESWQRFLGSSIQPIRWKDHIDETKTTKEDRFYAGLHKHCCSIRKFFKKFGLAEEMQKVVDAMADTALGSFESLQLEVG